MAAPAKFLFDTDFAAPDKTRERAATAAEIAEKIADAEARAYRAGYEAAQHEAKAESDRRSALALEEIGIAIKAIATRFSGIEARMETEAVDVAVAVARKLCSELVVPRAARRDHGACQRLLLASGCDPAPRGPHQRPALRRRPRRRSNGRPRRAASRAGW